MPDSGTRIQIAVVVAVMVLAVIGGVWYGGRAPDAVPVDVVAPIGAADVSDVSEAPGLESVTVHVAGAVLRPGLVSVPTPARIADAIAAAGGAAAGAPLGEVGAVRVELLEAVVTSVRHVEVSGGVRSHAVRPAKPTRPRS